MAASLAKQNFRLVSGRRIMNVRSCCPPFGPSVKPNKGFEVRLDETQLNDIKKIIINKYFISWVKS